MSSKLNKALSLLLYPVWAMAHVCCAAVQISSCILMGIVLSLSLTDSMPLIILGALVGAIAGISMYIVKPLFSEKLSEFKAFIDQLWRPQVLQHPKVLEIDPSPHFSTEQAPPHFSTEQAPGTVEAAPVLEDTPVQPSTASERSVLHARVLEGNQYFSTQEEGVIVDVVKAQFNQGQPIRTPSAAQEHTASEGSDDLRADRADSRDENGHPHTRTHRP